MTVTNHGLANTYISAHSRTLLYDDETGMYWWYRNLIWEPVSIDKLVDHIGNFCETKQPNVKFTMATFKDIAMQCRRKVRHVDEIEDHWLAFDDCLYNPDTKERVEHPPQKLNIDPDRNYLDEDEYAEIYMERIATIRLKMRFDDMMKAEAPMFMQYIRDASYNPVTKDIDAGTILQLQETYGLLLSSENPHKCIICFGDGGTGKSVGFSIMRHLVSKPRTLSQSLNALTKKDFALPALIGKRANIKDEEHASSSDIGILKTIIAGEPITCRRMYESDITFTPKVKMIFGSNKFPRFDSFDNSIRRRFLIITLDNIVPKHKRIIGLANKIIKAGELPGIVRWALEGLDRLQSNNFEFTMTKRSEKAMNDLKSSSSSVAEYIDDNWEASEKHKISAKEIYSQYVTWCRSSGRMPVSSNNFGREMTSLIGQSCSIQDPITHKIVRGYKAKPKSDIQENMGI